ncbi:MAG: hypothetical protein K5877_10855 [Lachnospiraceae bacterium]|nr:hypothetical protein [Lachnospiraceae bacterium]
MKRVIIRWLVIVIVFFAALFAFNILLNRGTTDMTIEMPQATLPVISVLYGDKKVNTMHGYVNRMDAATMRDSISPIGEERSLSFSVETFDTGISRVGYEVRNLDGSRLIEETTVGNYEHKTGKVVGTINLKDLIEKEKEYNLGFVLQLTDGRSVYYYTRLICDENIEVADKLDFILGFNSRTFSLTEVKELASYMEPNSDADNTSFGKVNIHSNIGQLGWGNMHPIIEGDIGINIFDVSRSTLSTELDYMVSVRNEAVVNYYHIKEFYRVRQGTDRFYLLSFDRTMDEIFTAEKESLANNKIVLGIQSDKLNIEESDDGNIIVIENCGRLFSYDVSANKMATLYAYYEAGDTDPRNTYDKSDVKILSVEENGNVAFMIYGYINRGVHEGSVGILVEYFNSLLNTVEEQIFIEYDKSAEILMADVEKLSYLDNNHKNLYVLMDGNIIKADMGTLETEIISDTVFESSLHVSQSGRLAVWKESELPQAQLLTIDMGDGFTSRLEKDESECIKPIGFMNDDLIYGVSRNNDIVTNVLGDITFLMDKLIIRSEYGGILKEYSFDDIYVVEGTIIDNQISLKRVERRTDGSFVSIHDDQITNNESRENGKNRIVYAVTDMFEKIAQIELKGNIDAKTLKFLTPKEVLFEFGRNAKTELTENKDRYYLYDRGHIILATDDPNLAIKPAFDSRSMVVDNKGNEVYKRGETHARNQIMSIKEDSMAEDMDSLSVCLDVMLKQRGISRNTEYLLAQGKNPYEILNDNLDGVHILNLTGCTMDVALYYLSMDIPVLGIAEDGRAVLLVGYNEQNMVWYDPDGKTIYKKGMSDSRDAFESAGNRFLTYSLMAEE